LVDDDRVHVVDWEASARGPAVVDYTDVVFHLVRDLLYEGVPPKDVPVGLMTRLPFSGPVLAWRLLLWLDRRRPEDIDLVTAREVGRLTAVSLLRAVGVPR
jgi:hypothetical protein